uniref:PA14 domain-containing protein n=1 Tax=Paenibacillus forsythiae TaxID=365616 RepID=UPI00047094C9
PEKPIAIGENGQMPDPAMLPKSQSKWVFMMTWGKMLYENNSTTTIKSFLNNGFTLTRDEIITAMAAFTAPAPSPTPTPTPSPTPTPTPSPTPTPTPSPTPDPVYQPIGQDSAMQDNPAEPAAVEPLPVPSATPEPPQARNGLLGEYFTNIQLTGTPVLTREESAIDFNWGTGAPDPSVGTDRFSVRWSGKIKALYSENYSFYTSSDDGIRLWVNGTAVITSWATQYGLERKGRIDLEAGKLYDIKIEYYDNTGSAKARLMWESPSQIKEVVPSGALYLPGSL